MLASTAVNNNTIGSNPNNIDADLLALVLDYLRERDFESTLKSLEKDLKDKQLHPNLTLPSKILAENKSNETEDLDELLIAVRQGQFGRFTIHWERLTKMHLDDPTFLALDFDIHLYFALYPQLFPDSNHAALSYEGSKNSMDLFKSYLSERGKDLTKLNDESYLVFYALPFVPDPKNHPSFKHVFETEWWEKVQTRFISFIKQKMDGLRKPALYYIYQNGQDLKVSSSKKDSSGVSAISSSTLLKTLQTQLKDSEDRELDLSQRFNLLKTNFQRLLSITSDLVEQMLGIMNGHQLNPQFISDVCERLMAFKKHGEDESILLRPKYPMHQYVIPASKDFESAEQSLVQENKKATLDQFQDSELPDLGTMVAASNVAVPTERPMTAIPVHQLEFSKILGILNQVRPENSSDQDILHMSRLLQALRWRFMGTGPAMGTISPGSIKELTAMDIFGISSNGGSWVTKWMNSKSLPNPMADWVVLEILLLSNAIASFPVGRGYLLSKSKWIIDFCLSFWDLKNPRQAAAPELTLPFHKLTWTILSKLSIRRQVQSYLLDQKTFALDFLTIMQDPEPLIGTWEEDPWTAERTLAMCMNLSLRRKARKIWSSQVSPDILLKILTDLMEHDHSHINTYANSAMFYLLGDGQFREAATALGIPDMLGYWLEQSTEDAVRQAQLSLLQKELENDPEYPIEDADTRSDDGKDDDFDKEDDVGTGANSEIIIPELIEETIFERLVDLLDHVDGEGVKGEEFIIKYGYGTGSILPNPMDTNNVIPPAIPKSTFSLPWTSVNRNYNTSSDQEKQRLSENNLSSSSYSRPRTPFDQQMRDVIKTSGTMAESAENTNYDTVFKPRDKIIRTPL